MAVPNNHSPSSSPYQLQQAPLQHTTQLHSAQQRPTRKSRTFSLKSDKSRGSQHKIDLHETHDEKEAKRLHSKADPTLAMQEAEPSEVAATGKSSLAPLRSIQHRDAFGNPIADPDRSNPTRSRWERPLDTIRSFEAAIDGGYSNRRSIIRTDTEGATWGASRRSSYYGGNGNFGRSGHDSYYGNRPPSMMYANRADGSLPDLRSAGMGQRDGYHDQQNFGYGGYGPPQQNGRRGLPRIPTEPQYSPPYRQQNPQDYPTPPNHRSYETVTTASGSGSSAEPTGYQTDPTGSDNSSLEPVQSVPRRQPEPLNDYGIGFGQSPSYKPPSSTVGVQNSGMNGSNYQLDGSPNYGNPNQGGNPVPPAVPRKDVGSVLRKQISTSHVQEVRLAQPEKRKSWLARRFSKRA
ncbi:hypothetical protein N657DRAFT_677138 [Parathielavia appendiculata]|uniref:Uncharacterized protein n=1 Tax=Parathielavia appendiculata TaxID=2587402 RepID=A0AAN6UBL4_9PEZI|nr:hypothetical protein N657DRAFT_677138 [Parathielavia appendiculata]